MNIVVTGLGIVSPAGIGVAPFTDALRRGRSLVRSLDELASATGGDPIGAAVPGFDAADALGRRLARRLDRSAAMFVTAAFEALADGAAASIDPERVGVYEGSSLAGLGAALREQETLLGAARTRPHPSTLTAAMTGAGSSTVSILRDIRGPVLTYSNGSASSACAVQGAVDQLRLGEVDLALVGGTEAPLHAPVWETFRRAGLLSARAREPARACRPFDATRDGVVLGEGAAVLVLERREHARRRGARILAEVLGMGLTSDACSLVAPAPDARERARAITKALAAGGVSADQVDYVSAHGTSTLLNDRVETAALKRALGAHAHRVAISSSKSMFGHALGASAAMELVKTVVCMNGGFVPPTVNLHTPDPECDLDYVPGRARARHVGVALVNSSSFGGKNASILLRRGDGAAAD